MRTRTEPEQDPKLEIAHVLLIDVVGYSKLLVNDQIEVLQLLNRVVRNAPHFRAAETANKLMRLPTGDGMALLFFDSPEAPVECALEISAASREHPELQLRMGVHSGPIKEVMDVNDRANYAGGGINLAQRVLDCGDAGHILLSGRVADDLNSYRRWHPHLTDLGECEVKHGLRMRLFNLCKDGLGNPALPLRCSRPQAQSNQTGGLMRPRLSRGRILQLCIAVATVTALAFAAWWFLRPAPHGRGIAVLPFRDIGGDAGANTILINGVEEDLLRYLGRISDLKVISRTSSQRYTAAADRNIRQIARELKVTHVLHGNVLRIGDRVRVHAHLIDGSTEAQVWSDRYEFELKDVFAIQTEIAKEIAGQLRLRLSSQEKAAIEETPTNNLEAHKLYVEAKNLIEGSTASASARADLLRAIELLSRATALDPKFYLAAYQLAHAHDQLFARFEPTPARLELADAAIRALEQLRPNSGETHLARARHFYWGLAQYAAARAQLSLAEQSLPNDPTIPLLTGYIDRRQSRWQQSTENLQRALELDPNNRYYLQQIALIYLAQRRFHEMAEVLDRVVVISGNDIAARAQRAAVDIDWRADTRRLRAVVASALAEDPASARKIADYQIHLAMSERDAPAVTAALADAPDGVCQTEALPLPSSWCAGLAARLADDSEAAGRAFRQMRGETARAVEAAPEDPGALCVLGLADAALGNKELAIAAGQRAAELVPITKDAVDGPLILGFLAVIYAWSGEIDRAIEQLEIATAVPSYWSYGNLKLHPQWDLLREDPRFQRILTKLAPKD